MAALGILRVTSRPGSTHSGYVGDDAGSCLVSLIEANAVLVEEHSF